MQVCSCSHYDYFDEARAGGKGTVGWYISKGDGSVPIDELMVSIDAEFVNSPAETKTMTEAAFAQQYAKQFGNIGLIVTLILAAVVFMILLVTGHTMAQSVRERIHEMGVLKTLGFTSRGILGMTVAEGLLLVTPVGLVAMALGAVTLKVLADFMGSMFPGGLGIGAYSMVLGVSLMLAIALGSVLPPVIRAAQAGYRRAVAVHVGGQRTCSDGLGQTAVLGALNLRNLLRRPGTAAVAISGITAPDGGIRRGPVHGVGF